MPRQTTARFGGSTSRFSAARWPALLATLAMLAGCGNIFYAKTPVGKFSGKLDVEWIGPNEFIYRPHAKDPLLYVASDGRSIQPRAMFTDGGSIPRLFWSVPNFGPWEFAPGFIIHDWLFLQHHCKEGDWEAYSFQRSAEILAEAMKTQSKGDSSNAAAAWAIYEAVRTPIAKARWDSGECRMPPAEPAAAPPGAPGAPSAPSPFGQPVKLFTIEFK